MKNELVVKELKYKILKNISFSLYGGNIYSLLGKNSSGKTLLIMCIAGLVETNNCISLNNKVITYKDLNKDIGVYVNNANLTDNLVLYNLIEPLINIGTSQAKSKKIVYDISKKLGIDSLIYKDINSLSYGEKKFISILKSIIHQPKLILLDNPFEGLDKYYKERLINYLQHLKSSQNSIIIFTTNNGEDLLICNSLIIINSGKLISIGEKEKIFEDEKILSKNGISIPFIIDLSYKLKSYELIDKLVYDNKEMMDVLWK